MGEVYLSGSIGRSARQSPAFGLRVGNGSLVHVSGELDCATAPSLAAALRPLVAAGGDIGVDLAGLAFMDVMGLTVLHEAAVAVGERGRIIVYDPPPSATRLIELSGLAAMIVIDDHDTARSVHRRRPRGPELTTHLTTRSMS